MMFFGRNKMNLSMNRRHFLTASGMGLLLPHLGATNEKQNDAKVSRFVAINIPLGLYADSFFPLEAGRDYELSPYLQSWGDIRNDFTVISGTSHPGIPNGHESVVSFLSSAPGSGRAGFVNTISLDQHIAKKRGHLTRYPYLCLKTTQGGNSISIHSNGNQVHAEVSARRVFEKLFLNSNAKTIKKQRQEWLHERSILDSLGADLKHLQKSASKEDKEKLEEYLSSLRETEKRLQLNDAWLDRPRPKPLGQLPPEPTSNTDVFAQAKMMLDLAHLALASDSTRVITINFGNLVGVPQVEGVTYGYHALSHHAKRPELIRQLNLVEGGFMKLIHGFIKKLKATKLESRSLLDQSTVFVGSNLGNASGHDTSNLPALLAGGSFHHGQHLAFDKNNNTPLANLYTSILQSMNLANKPFGSASGALEGFKIKNI
jgi:hypothetical protein